MAGAYGFYKDGEMKISSYKGEGSPKILGHAIHDVLFYSWPQEISYMFDQLIMVKSYANPTVFEFETIMAVFGKEGYDLPDFEKINFEMILGERQSSMFSYFVSVRHAKLRYMLDAEEIIKTWGVTDWVYIYNLDKNELEIYHQKETMPETRTLTDDTYVYLQENFDLIHTMAHDPGDLGRNQFTKNGMDEAYNKYIERLNSTYIYY